MLCINGSGRFTKYITKQGRFYSSTLAFRNTVQITNYRLWDRMHEVLVHNTWRIMNEKIEYLD